MNDTLKIVGKSKVDSQGRVNLAGLFYPEFPKEVVVSIDSEMEMIEITPATEDEPKFGTRLQIDDKKRLVIPKWIREEFSEKAELLLIQADQKKYLSVKTGNLLPKET
ncbi:hypothetical protein IJJ49_02660 [Candidatus Saccharibacteria bacterium]|nr:hypothetical protein [Candidatus Saccharibacteria bacterium]